MPRKKKPKIDEEIKLAIIEKIHVLTELAVIRDNDHAKEIRERMEWSIISQPDRDPEVIIDQIGRELINAFYG